MLVAMRVGSKVPAPYMSCSNVLAATKVLGQATAKDWQFKSAKFCTSTFVAAKTLQQYYTCLSAKNLVIEVRHSCPF